MMGVGGYYLYRAGGDTEVAQKKLEREFDSTSFFPSPFSKQPPARRSL